MISGLWNGVTGLNTFERALNTQSNNVTNSNTIAHKKDDVSFEDLMYQSRYGNGVQIQNVEKNFQQGNLKVTNNTLDVAIDGQGFFIVNDVKTGETLYTRAGNFKMGTDGTLQTAYGDKIYGSPTTFSSIVSTDGTQTYNNNYTKFIATEPINGVGFSRTINAKATDYTLTAVDTGVSGQGFKSSSALLNDIRVLSAKYNAQLDLYSANPVEGTASTAKSVQVSYSDFSSELTSGYIEIYIDGDNIKQPYTEVKASDAFKASYLNAADTTSKLSFNTGLNLNDDTVSIDTVKDLTRYELNLDGNTVFYDSGVGATLEEISEGLLSAIKDNLATASSYSLATVDTNTGVISLNKDATSITVNSYESSLSTDYDTVASQLETMKLFSDKLSNIPGIISTIDNNGLLNINSLIPGDDFKVTGAGINSKGYGINEVVAPVSGTGYAAVNSVRDALRDAIVIAGGEFLEVTNTINDAGPSLAGIGELQLKLDDLNISENVFGVLSIEDGLIYAKDQDNKFLIGKLETVTFQNPESLEPKGETLYTIGKDTGDPYNADNLNTLTGGSIELSNTNFSESLVDLMVYQRAFEASSKSVTTSDEFLRTAIEMKK